MITKVEYYLGTVRSEESRYVWLYQLCLLFVAVYGPVEYDPEYQLIVESNNMLVEIDNEICKLLISAYAFQLHFSYYS